MQNLFAVILILVSFNAFSQERPHLNVLLDHAPSYILESQKADANMFKVTEAFKTYYLQHPFEKNSYTQYYKRWMHWASRNHDAKGNIIEHNPVEQEKIQLELLQSRQHTQHRNRIANWKFLGPNQTFHTDGTTEVTWQTNIYSLDVAQSNPNILYAGGETGGIWKTINKGLNWTLLTANVLHGSFTAIRIHPTNPDIVYAGTSGKFIKTIDGGKTWTTVYSETNMYAHEMKIHPTSANIIFAASNRGLIFSTDAGNTWKKAFTNECWTVQFKVNNPNISYAIRQNGVAGEFLQSTNNGTSWTAISSSFYKPTGDVKVTGAHIAICPNNASKLYAYLCGSGTNVYGYIGVFVSDDAGFTWRNTNPNNQVGEPYEIPNHTNLMAHDGVYGFNQGFYDMAIVVHPEADDILIAGGTSWFISGDSGGTWSRLGGYVGGLPWSHPDIQSLRAIGNDLWITSDGGINYSNDFGGSMQARMNGISGSDMWGFDSGWNDDILVGGRYHNGNMAWHESFPGGKFYRMGGGEAATGYVSPSAERKTYFSDIGGYILKDGFTSGVSSFPVGLFPNESYAYYQASPMTWHPNCWNIIYLGNKNKLWKSEDGGSSFNALYTFPGADDKLVFEVEISRSHPNVMYVSQWDGTDDAIWKSEDGGKTFKQTTKLPLPNNNDRVKMSLSNENPNELWVIVTYGSNGKKVYYTNNGGLSWTNWTTAILDNIQLTDVLCQYGTNGGVYLGSDRGVFYRNHNLQEWQLYSTGLPLSAETNRLRPFYRDGKLRNGCWGFGVWETELYEESRVQAKIMADKLKSNCLRDTFYLDDYSVVNHKGASWTWEVEDAQYHSNLNARQIKLVFKSTGTKRVIMHLQTSTGIYHDTLILNQEHNCVMDSIPGNALSLDGVNATASIKALYLKSNTVTMSAWIKPNSSQKDWAGIFFCRGGSTTAGLSVLSNLELRYHWNGSQWGWSSGKSVKANEWSHVALVIYPDSARIYVNGEASTHRVKLSAEEFDSNLLLGLDANGSDRHYSGLIDEFSVFNRSLSEQEIREMMHLTKTHTNNTGLVLYHQFNNQETNLLDNYSIYHASLGGNASLIRSKLPVGPGFSKQLRITANGTVDFGKEIGLSMDITNTTNPNGNCMITRLNTNPSILANSNPHSPAYWLIYNYGSNRQITSPIRMQFASLGNIRQNANEKEYYIYQRKVNAELENWNVQDTCDQITNGKEGICLFNSIRNLGVGQLVITKTHADTSIVSNVKQINTDSDVTQFSISPNPVMKGNTLRLFSSTEENVQLRIYNIQGVLLKKLTFNKQTDISTQGFAKGVYQFVFETEKKMKLVFGVVE